MKTLVWIASLATALLPALACANADKLAMILQQQREIREESERSTGTYARFGSEALGRMQAAQDRVFALLDGKRTLDQLHPDEQVELFNALEEVKAIIAQNEGSRQRCWREHKLGSTMAKTRCATMDELQNVRNDAQTWKGEPTICGQRDAFTDCGGNTRMGGGKRL